MHGNVRGQGHLTHRAGHRQVRSSTPRRTNIAAIHGRLALLEVSWLYQPCIVARVSLTTTRTYFPPTAPGLATLKCTVAGGREQIPLNEAASSRPSNAAAILRHYLPRLGSCKCSLLLLRDRNTARATAALGAHPLWPTLILVPPPAAAGGTARGMATPGLRLAHPSVASGGGECHAGLGRERANTLDGREIETRKQGRGGR